MTDLYAKGHVPTYKHTRRLSHDTEYPRVCQRHGRYAPSSVKWCDVGRVENTRKEEG